MDEGFSTWQQDGYPVAADQRVIIPSSFQPAVRDVWIADVDDVRSGLAVLMYCWSILAKPPGILGRPSSLMPKQDISPARSTLFERSTWTPKESGRP